MTQTPPPEERSPTASSRTNQNPDREVVETNRLTWRVGLLGAGSALLGGLVGAVASLGIAIYGFEQEEDRTNRESARQAYLSFDTAASAVLNAAITEVALRTILTKLAPDVLSARSAVVIFGTPETNETSAAVQTTMLAFTETLPDGNLVARTAFADALVEYRYAVRSALDVD